MASLHLALIGAGLIGIRHLHLMSQISSVNICAIVDPSDHAKSMAKERAASYFRSLQDFLKSGVRCDGVVIATPNDTHRPIALDCFDHGLPCLIEKPLAATSEDAVAIADASAATGVAVLVGHHRRHHTISQITKKNIDNGMLGQLVGAQLTWMLRKPDEYFKAGAWRLQKGGGPIWINLIHEIDLLRYFMGEIVDVSAMFSSTTRGNAVEDTAVVNMRCGNGALVSAIISDCAPSPWHFEGGTGENPNICKTGEGGFRVFGTSGALEFPCLTHWRHDDPGGHWGTPIHCHNIKSEAALDGEVALTNQLNHFADVIQNSTSPLVSVRDGVQNVRVIEAILHSAQDGSNVKIPIS